MCGLIATCLFFPYWYADPKHGTWRLVYDCLLTTLLGAIALAIYYLKGK